LSKRRSALTVAAPVVGLFLLLMWPETFRKRIFQVAVPAKDLFITNRP
jgi:hypothetical protein